MSGLYAAVLMPDGSVVDAAAYGSEAKALLVRGNYIGFDAGSADDLIANVNGRTTVRLIAAGAVHLP